MTSILNEINSELMASDNFCPICGNIADKTNAHLIPWFIIKHAITQGGSGLRDKELSFTISTGHFTKVYTGRSVLPETIEEYTSLDPLQIEKDNPYSRDHLICIKCEEKLSHLEAIFATQFPQKRITHLSSTGITRNNQTVLIDPHYDHGLFQLFIQFIFYRCSIGKFDGFSLHSKIEKSIQHNLSECFVLPNFKKLRMKDQLKITHYFPIVTSLLHSHENEDTTKEFILINKVRFPYFLMGGRWLFQLFEKEAHINGSQERLYGHRYFVPPGTFYPLIKEKSHLILLDQPATEHVIKERLADFVDKKINAIRKDIRDFHLHIFKRSADGRALDYIFGRYLHHYENTPNEVESFRSAFLDFAQQYVLH